MPDPTSPSLSSSSSDRQPLVPPVLRRFQNTKRQMKPQKDGAKELEDCHSRACGEAPARTSKNVQATHRAPKSTIHGVVNQFGQFRSQRSVADRVLSSFVNIFRRICSHEERVSCSLDDYQSNNMGIDSTHESRCSEPATSQLNTSGNSIEKAMTDSEDLPILMMLTMTEARQCTNLQAAIRCRWLERNPKRKRLTSVSGQQWPNVCKIKDSNSIEKVKCFDEIAATQVSLTLSHPSKGTQLSDMPQTGLLKIFQKSKNGQTRKSCDRKSADSARDEYSISSFDDEEAAMTLGCQEFLRFISL